MYSPEKDFEYLCINTMRTKSGLMYQARLISKLGRKTIGLGSEKIQALNIALLIDEKIKEFINNGELVDLDALRSLAEEEKAKTRVHKGTSLKIVEKDDLLVLWENYVKFHLSLRAWEDTYYYTHIQTVTNILRACPIQKLEQKNKLVEWIFSNKGRSAKTSKNRLKLIVAAIDWNSKNGNIPRKWGIEYRDLLNSINIKIAKKSLTIAEDEDVDIFSVSEVYSILEALREETYSRFKGKHYQYYKYVYFCWLTGCRPSEAIALKWQNVDLTRKRIKFCEAEVNASGRLIKKQGTKTVDSRYFPINNELMRLLKSLAPGKGYVFTRENGKPISQHAFNRVWRNLLDGMGIKYRIPYQLRHTMISYHANNDYPIHKLAEIVGNSEAIIKEHYLRLDIERISLPEIKI